MTVAVSIIKLEARDRDWVIETRIPGKVGLAQHHRNRTGPMGIRIGVAVFSVVSAGILARDTIARKQKFQIIGSWRRIFKEVLSAGGRCPARDYVIYRVSQVYSNSRHARLAVILQAVPVLILPDEVAQAVFDLHPVVLHLTIGGRTVGSKP